jgi:hypothetical protein
MERLDFVLPKFVRYCWASDRAKGIWETRVNRIRKAWKHIEWLSVAKGVRSCSQTIVGVGELVNWTASCSEQGLSILTLQMTGKSKYPCPNHQSSFKSESKDESSYMVVVGRFDSVQEFRKEWDKNNHAKLGNLLGYPTCCCEFFQKVWVGEKFIYTTWRMALNSVESKNARKEYI